jgi:hypothetical protein
MARNGRGRPDGLPGFRLSRHHFADDAPAIFDRRHLLRRLGRLLSHRLEPGALEQFQIGSLAARIQMAAADRAESEGLRRPSFSVPSLADSVSVVFRTRHGGQSGGGFLFEPRADFGLLAALLLQGRLSAALAARAFNLREPVLLPDEHGKGAALDDYHFGHRDLPFVREKIRLAAPFDVRVRLDVQPFSAALFGRDFLDADNRLERTPFRVATARLHGRRDGSRKPYQPVFPAESWAFSGNIS